MNVALIHRLFCAGFISWLTVSVFIDYYIYIILFIAFKIAYPYLEEKYKDWLPVDKRNVLITGCDTGKVNDMS